MTVFSFRPDFKDVLDDVLLPIPGIKGGKAFGHVAYTVNGKIFCFVGTQSVMVKLPAKRVQALIAELPEAGPFEANGIWKEWVTLTHDDADDYRQHEDIYHESLEYVSSK